MKKIIIIIFFLQCLFIYCIDKADTHSGEIINTPQRIISLSPAITEELYLLKSDDLLVADTYYCNRPPDAKKKKKIGDLTNFDLETVINLKPDLILCTELANRKKINKLKQLGYMIIVFPPPKSFSEICDNLLKLGTVINKKDTAVKIINDVEKEAAHIRESADKFPKKKIFIQIGARPLFTANKGYFINDYIEYSGGINICENVKSNLVSRESVVMLNPDVIIITDMGIASEEEREIWRRYKAINAVKKDAIFIVNSDIFCNPTIITFLEALKTTAFYLNPGIKL